MRIFQPIITGSFSVSGSVFFPTLVTSSTVVSNVVMFGANGELFTTASSAIGGGGGVSSDYVTTASFNAYTGSNTSQFAGTASHAITAENVTGTVTTALTASYATNFTIGSKLSIDSTLTDYAEVLSTIVGANNLFTQPTGSYNSAFVKYSTVKGTNARAGEFITVWNGTTVTYYDNSTTDIGNTSDISFTSTIVTGNIQINAQALSSGWLVKTLITYI
jgi:hypothetical protein